MKQPRHDKYRIMVVLKVETEIITCITTSLIGRAEILEMISVETFKTDVSLFIGNADVTPRYVTISNV